jgi:multiple sugar transport system ATP-binding protein
MVGESAAGQMIDARVELVEPLGSDLMVHASIEVEAATGLDDIAELAEDSGEALPDEGHGTIVVARFNPRSTVRIGEDVQIAVATDRLHFFDSGTGEAIRDAAAGQA